MFTQYQANNKFKTRVASFHEIMIIPRDLPCSRECNPLYAFWHATCGRKARGWPDVHPSSGLKHSKTNPNIMIQITAYMVYMILNKNGKAFE